MKKPLYCVYPDVKSCSTCSLVNYGMDCMNQPTWGGKRSGSGRKPVEEKRKPYAFRLTLEEHKTVKEFIATMKSRPTGEKEEEND